MFTLLETKRAKSRFSHQKAKKFQYKIEINNDWKNKWNDWSKTVERNVREINKNTNKLKKNRALQRETVVPYFVESLKNKKIFFCSFFCGELFSTVDFVFHVYVMVLKSSTNWKNCRLYYFVNLNYNLFSILLCFS